MNYKDLKNSINHLLKTSKCVNCDKKYTEESVHVIAATKMEALFDLNCSKCHASTLFTVVITPDLEISQTSEVDNTRIHGKISKNDILDMKNFLNKFDGNFKKIFIKDK